MLIVRPAFFARIVVRLRALAVVLVIMAGPACLRFECSPTDAICKPEAFLLYLDFDCNFTQTLQLSPAAGSATQIFQEAYIKASNADDDDEFASQLDFDCSTQTLVVNSIEEASAATGVNGDQFDNSAGGSGAVYVLRFNGEARAWFQEAYIKASNTEATDNFGTAVALNGDTLAVGALQEDSAAIGVNGDQADNAALQSGAVYVFRRGTDDVWRQEAYIKASNSEAGDRFGFAVALDDDVLVVTTRNEASAATGVGGDQSDNSAANAGAAYVFRRTGTTWSQEAYLKASNTGGGDGFGRHVALSGDTVAVGALEEASNATGVNPLDQSDNSAASAGAVYVFRNFGTQWIQEAYIKSSNTAPADRFGQVALSGSVLAVAARDEDSSGLGVNPNAQADNAAANSGAVYVFRRGDFGWIQEAYIKATNTGASDAFGSTLGVSGSTLAIGAPAEGSSARGVGGDQNNDAAPTSGAVYVYQFTNGSWAPSEYIKSSNSDGADGFGAGLSLSGNGLVVGTNFELSQGRGVGADQSNNAGSNVGAAYVFR